MSTYILGLHEIDHTMVALVGGKAAGLGALTHIAGVQVPTGFCITTTAYEEMVGQNKTLDKWLTQLAELQPDNRKEIAAVCTQIRTIIEGITIPEHLSTAILTRLEAHQAYAIRSSATAEDLPTASFAGQQDTYLNITGNAAILQHIRKCWASLYTDRAVIYRLQNGFDHRKASLAVIIQQMIFPTVSGILFTADPVTANRKVLSIDASFGLGEALVSGLVNADNFKVRENRIIDRNISTKKLAVVPLASGGTITQELPPAKQILPSLTDTDILKLDQLGREIEAYFGVPQDIEWCLADHQFYILQSRPITTLFPLPAVQDEEKHYYISVGHNQMMTDAMKPLGLSFFLTTTRASMYKAGGRLFVDVAQQLATPAGRDMLINAFGKSDLLIKNALLALIARENFPAAATDSPINKNTPPSYSQIKNDPAIVTELIANTQSSFEILKENIQARSGAEIFDFIRKDLSHFREELLSADSLVLIMAAMDASVWINEKMEEWLGEKGVADTVSLSTPNNITAEMGLALLDVADIIRPYPAIVHFLHQAKEDTFMEELPTFNGGEEVRGAIQAYLDKYGMRCVGEIDVTKTRWSEKPTILLPMLLSNIKNFAPNASTQKFEAGQQAAFSKKAEILQRLKLLPDGEQKATETEYMIDLVRNFIGYREYPKYALMSRYYLYKQAIMKEAELLVTAGVIGVKEDVYYLTFEELQEVVRTQQLDLQLIEARKEEFKQFEKLTPPRVMTGEGEIITGTYKKDHLPAGAVPGLPVSSGVMEGRARVILNMEEADLEEGDILVTTYTDPSWTPVFVSVKGLVTEVGGLMTHGAVIAREYGLPAVVGVENATKLIKDGDIIRVNGTDGYVEIL
ncbi:MAG: phosphoenolpyruvate synthase [Chitinophaga sp.]|uniref:phosphoenolpyruvate synthase n=1 Tax=Chitinophaga sp. TaxID=1869181 RepID=UPI0025C49CA5|nr:phosphoenolpyruvate synthase [Chitinophaga sp.]MBV8252371.1 phosphoenolpyruvate synthase [Chitinophaga sp.]